MAGDPDGSTAQERPHFCPWCGTPVGSFFGRFGTDGATWCDACEEWFRAQRCDEHPPDPGE